LKDSEDYLKRLKELREELEKRMTEKAFEEIHNNVFKILKSLFGNKSESILINDYEKEIVNKAKGNPKFLHTLNELISMKKKYKSKKAPSKYAFERLRRDSVYLIQEIIEYSQRKELGLLQKTKVTIASKGKLYDLILTKPTFLVSEKGIMKIEGVNVKESDVNEMNKTLASYKGGRIKIDKDILTALEKELGDYEISL